MIKSMTGYGRAVAAAGDDQVVVEVASVNRKNLDVAVALPKDWQRLEPEIVAAVREHVQRGRINILVATEAADGGDGAFFGREVEAALGELRELCERSGIPYLADARLVVEVASAIRGKAVSSEVDAIREPLFEALEKALSEMVTMRATEGEALGRDLAERTGKLAEAVREIREAAAEVVPDYREALMKRLRQAGLDLTLDDERVLKEIALFADRVDISEELTRLESHFEQLGEFLDAREPVGRKLEFLLQEIGREFNTIGSKANETRVSRLVIDCKNELERMREQVQNVE